MKKIKLLSTLCAISTASAIIPAVTSCVSTANTDSGKGASTVKNCKIYFNKGQADKIEGTTVQVGRVGRLFGTVEKPIIYYNGNKISVEKWKDVNSDAEYSNADKIPQQESLTVIPVFATTIKVNFNTMDGSMPESFKQEDWNNIDTTKSLESQSKTLPEPTRPGATFKTWISSDGTEITPSSTLKDTHLFAKYEAVESKHVLLFKTDYGKFTKSGSTLYLISNIDHNKTLEQMGITLPEITEESGKYELKNFKTVNGVFNEQTVITEDLIIDADMVAIKKTFDDTSWSELIEYSKEYYLNILSGMTKIGASNILLSYFSDITKMDDFIGKTKTLKVNNLDHIVKIVGTALDDSNTYRTDKIVNGTYTGLEALFVFEFSTLWTETSGTAKTFKWSSSSSLKFDDTNPIKAFLTNTVESTLSDILDSSIKQVEKKYAYVDDTEEDTEQFYNSKWNTKIWIPTVPEICPSLKISYTSGTTISFSTEYSYSSGEYYYHEAKTQDMSSGDSLGYKYYSNFAQDSYKQKQASGSSSATNYWLLSPSGKTGVMFSYGYYSWGVTSAGILSQLTYSSTYGIAPMFCI